VSAIETLDAKPYLLFGDCMGALISYEAARMVRSRGGRQAAALIIASYPSPDQLRTTKPYHQAPTGELRQRLREVGGVPPAVLEDDELFELLLPTLRLDFAAFERYRYVPEAPLDIDIHAIGGRGDPYVSASALECW
jgi:medium-chain acyl-[acyl-carrier-protein] hydrolase